MPSEAIISVSAAVVALTQLIKWAGVGDRWGPLLVLALAALGVVMWGVTQPTFHRTDTFSYFAAWIAIATSAAGVYGFTRASASAITSMAPPPHSGAGSEPTERPPHPPRG